MADEQAPVEVETTVEETPNETPAETPEATPEVVKEEPDRGDLRVPLQEERRKRQELERLSADPQWVYEQAKKLGLAGEDENPPPAAPAPSNQVTPEAVERIIDIRETVKARPEFDPEKGDLALVKWASALVADGHLLSQAVDIIDKTMDKRLSQAKVEGAKEKERAILDKEQATSVTSTSSTTSESAEMAQGTGEGDA
jgi:hypothetical protein